MPIAHIKVARPQAEHNVHDQLAFYRACAEIAQPFDVRRMLDLIVSHARLLLAADIANVMMLEEEDQELRLRACIGADAAGSAVKLGIGLSGLAAKQRAPVIAADYFADPRINPSAIRLARAAGLKSYLVVPMSTGQRVVGVLAVANRALTRFTSAQVHLLSEFADRAATALENARASQLREQKVMRLEGLVDELTAQQAVLSRSIAIRDHFSDMLLDGKGGDDIAAALSRLVENPVVIEQGPSRRLSVELDGPEVEGSRLELKADRMALLPVPVRSDGGESCAGEARAGLSGRGGRLIRVAPTADHGDEQVVAPIVSGNELLGYLAVTEKNRRLDQLDLVVIEQAAKAVGLDLVNQKRAFEMECRLRGDFVGDLVDGNYDDEETIVRRAARVGVDLAIPCRVIVVHRDDAADQECAQQPADLDRRLFSAICSIAMSHPSSSAIGSNSGGVVALCRCGSSDTSRASRGAVFELANHIKRQLRKVLPEITISIGIGRVCSEPRDYRESYREASRVLHVLKNLGQKDRIVFFEEMDAQCLLYEGYQAGRLAKFVDDLLGPLLEEEKRHGLRLVTTLAQFLENKCSLSKTAADMFLHVNTLKYRLQRCEAIGNLDLEDADTRFNLQLALRIAKVAGRCQF